MTGLGPEYSREPGRYHRIQQRTTYCSNNILVSISEVLFHMYRKALDAISACLEYSHVAQYLFQPRVLVVFGVSQIDDMVLVESQDVQDRHGTHLSGTMLVHPDPHYKVLPEFAEELRSERAKGVFYPSARHSLDLAFAFFDDNSNCIMDDTYELLHLELRLVTEDQNPAIQPTPITREIVRYKKLHATMGHYAFTDPATLQNLDSAGLLYPQGLPNRGMVDFVRRHYVHYPHDAVRP